VFSRLLDSFVGDEDEPEVRNNVGALTVARLTANACYRFAPPFLATISRGIDVSLDEIGIALATAELAGLISPLTARGVDRLSRRTAMVGGLVGVAAGTALAASSHGLVMFAVALVVLAQSKVVFDLGLGSWIADHVPYQRRSRIVGLTETSWAFGLLIGVSLMGLATGLTSWRGGYLVGAGAVAWMAIVIARRLPRERHHAEIASQSAAADALDTRVRISGRVWLVMVGAFTLMAASQSLFVTFGSWLEDSFEFTPAALSAVVFGLGLGELLASVTSARRTDAWGKENSTAVGALIMVPTGLALALAHQHLALALLVLAIGIAGFEFAIVSLLALGSTLVAGSPARGLGLMLAGGTMGRAVASIPATRLYERHGMAWPALLSAGFAALTFAAMMAARSGEPNTPRRHRS
jgi:predicted MFS family arabinose efflux permease